MGDKGYVEAVKWYRKAAEQNYAEAQFNLGLCYENGQGRCPKTGEASSDAHTRAFFNKGVWWMPPPRRRGRGESFSLPPPFTPPPVAPRNWAASRTPSRHGRTAVVTPTSRLVTVASRLVTVTG